MTRTEQAALKSQLVKMGQALWEAEAARNEALAEVARLRDERDELHGRAMLYLVERDKALAEVSRLWENIRYLREVRCEELSQEIKRLNRVEREALAEVERLREGLGA